MADYVQEQISLSKLESWLFDAFIINLEK